jgi:hypothetical protein
MISMAPDDEKVTCPGCGHLNWAFYTQCTRCKRFIGAATQSPEKPPIGAQQTSREEESSARPSEGKVSGSPPPNAPAGPPPTQHKERQSIPSAVEAHLPGETALAEYRGTDAFATLSNRRVRYRATSWTGEVRKSIPLENIDSFVVATEQKLWLLILGILASLLGLGALANDAGILSLVPGPILLIIWWLTRREGGFIYSYSGRIESCIFIRATGSERATVGQFVGRVEEEVLKLKETRER